MFDYYKAWDKFADKAEQDVDGKGGEQEDGGIIPAKNPVAEKEKVP